MDENENYEDFILESFTLFLDNEELIEKEEE